MTIQKSPSGRIWRVPKNTAGRDYVVGDIHGAYDTLKAALKQIGFKPGIDRLFSVGDLIDRGEDSVRVSRFLDMPGAMAIKGNHEDWYLHFFGDAEPPPEAIFNFTDRNGMEWVRTIDTATRLEIAAKLRVLPVVIEIETDRGTVGLVHAEVPIGMDWATFLEKIEDGDEATISSALEGRKRIKSGDSSGVMGVGRLFVGHTIQWGGIQRLGNIYAVDTGAIFGETSAKKEGQIAATPGDGHLTLARISMNSGPLAAPTAVGGTDIRDAEDEPQRPFGNYARPTP